MAHRSLARCSTAFLLLAAVVSACGDDDPRTPGYEASCDAACDRRSECDSSVDIAECATDCRQDASAIGPNLSTTYLNGLDDCIQDLTCPELAAATVFNTCDREVKARVPPSTTAEDFCEEVVASIEMCTGISIGTATCLDSFKVFSDAALARATACSSRSCDERIGCVTDELGLDPTAS